MSEVLALLLLVRVSSYRPCVQVSHQPHCGAAGSPRRSFVGTSTANPYFPVCFVPAARADLLQSVYVLPHRGGRVCERERERMSGGKELSAGLIEELNHEEILHAKDAVTELSKKELCLFSPCGNGTRSWNLQGSPHPRSEGIPFNPYTFYHIGEGVAGGRERSKEEGGRELEGGTLSWKEPPSEISLRRGRFPLCGLGGMKAPAASGSRTSARTSLYDPLRRLIFMNRPAEPRKRRALLFASSSCVLESNLFDLNACWIER